MWGSKAVKCFAGHEELLVAILFSKYNTKEAEKTFKMPVWCFWIVYFVFICKQVMSCWSATVFPSTRGKSMVVKELMLKWWWPKKNWWIFECKLRMKVNGKGITIKFADDQAILKETE